MITARNRRRPNDMSGRAVWFPQDRAWSLLARIAGSLAETEEPQVWKVDAQCLSRPAVRTISRLTAENGRD